MGILQNQLHACLDALEEQEASLLVWGDCNGFFSEEEILSLIVKILPEHDPEIVKIELIEHAMLFEVPHQQGVIAYRTRMGEAVHLYRNLRQWFHRQSVDQSRSLVSDYRFIRRPRSYPKRDINPHSLLSKWKEEANLSEIVIEAMEQLIEPLDRFRLSGFQTRSTLRICNAWKYHSNPSKQIIYPTGTIVCAGTGSGKTLSFYLPALAMLVGDVCKNPDNRVRILAIYPRKELLKDQFMETWNQCRKLDNLMNQAVGRKLCIGAFFGDTPYNLKNALDTVNKQSRTGLAFDLLRCVTPNCFGTMVWKKSHIEGKRQELTCTNCDHRVGSEEVGLTRQFLSQQVPDILFTTTEMLNQHLGNNYQNHLFGVGYNIQGPLLVLLDEVHTYGGNTGAQTAFLLRRWMQRAWCRPHFVGLSATLADAESFFAQLIGADFSRVELVEPKHDEMEDRNAEYLLALRGDPVSQTALLSTTIQTAMLTRRVLDTIQQGRSKGCWGSKGFIFTDDLDVTNRLYHQLSDAEGWRTSYRGLQPNGVPLAHLRESDFDQRKIDLGQNWRVPQEIGHSLSADDRAIISRTSSQDAGVDANAVMVVATASLEVGFNDPQVGAVIQHKAPRDVSSYLQRKGRAGRPANMRPWMIVILSEFGRDRVAFQRYEELISPVIKRQDLPLHNSHIHKMQAAMATLDWLSSRIDKGAIWSILNNPQRYASQCRILLAVVEEILTPGETQDKYINYLGWALGLDEKALMRILWMTPRSLMLEFLPTLHRLLITDWRELGEPWGALPRNRSPLPLFIPEALFSKLNILTLSIALQRGRDPITEWKNLYFFQGMREFAPGRISKRYATTSDFESDWLVPENFRPVAGTVMQVFFEISEAFGNNIIFEKEVQSADGEVINVYRPTEIYTRHLTPRLNLTEKSNAFLKWNVSFSCTSKEVLPHEPPLGSWQNRLLDICFYSHRQMTPLEVTRYTTGSFATLRFRGGDDAHIHFHWKMDGQGVGIGDRQWVDGVRLRLKITSVDLMELMADLAIMRALRPVYFRHCVSQLEYFENDSFTANWVSECFLAALANELGDIATPQSDSPGKIIQDGLETLHTVEGLEKLMAIPLSLFQPDEQQLLQEQSLHDRLRSLFSNHELIEQIHRCADILWEDPTALPDFEEWFRMIIANTMAGVTQQMLYVLMPDVEEQAVLADAIWMQDVLEIWLTETEGGGSGIIDKLSLVYYEDPVYFLNILVRCLEPSDYEQVDYDLFSMLRLLKSDGQLKRAVEGVRTAQDHKGRRQATSNLLEKLKGEGFAISHSFTSVLFSRVLRPGSSSITDNTLLDLLSKWNFLELKTGLEWSLNIVAHTLSSQSFKGDISPDQIFKRFCQFIGLLWPRGSGLRQSELGYYNPFLNGSILTERLLGAALFEEHPPQVMYQTEESWLNVYNAIRQFGRVDLVIERQKINQISNVIAHLQTEVIDHLGLLLHPRLIGVRRVRGQILLRVEMAEMLQ